MYKNKIVQKKYIISKHDVFLYIYIKRRAMNMHGKPQVPSALVIINPDLPATHPVRGIMLLIQPYFCSCG